MNDKFSLLKRMRRLSGILVHPTSLPGKFGIGDLGPEAYRFRFLTGIRPAFMADSSAWTYWRT